MNYFSRAPQGQTKMWQNGQKLVEKQRGFNPTVLKGDWNFTDCKGDTIYATYDYHRFYFNASNRPVNLRHVEVLKASYEVKDLNTVIDATVDGEITDGQHRYTMFKETGRPVIFKVVFNQTIADVQTLNSTSKKWKLADYASYYRAEEERQVEKGTMTGPGPYTMITQVSATYDTSLEQLLGIFNPTQVHTNGLRPSIAFRDGYFKMTVSEKENLVKKVLYLKEILTYYHRAFHKYFSRAYSQALSNPRFKHKTFLRRLKQGHPIYEKLSIVDHKAQIEKYYNYGLKQTNRIKI